MLRNRKFNLSLAITLAVVLVVLLTVTIASSAAAPAPTIANANEVFRQVELSSYSRPASYIGGDAFFEYRRGEWPIKPIDAHYEYRRGEWFGN